MAGCRARGLPIVLAAILVLPVLASLLAPAAVAAKAVAEGELPSKRAGAAAVTIGNGVSYVIGGRSGQNYLDEIVKYDAATGVGTVVASLPPVDGVPGTTWKPGRQSASALYDGQRYVWIFGGAAPQSAGDLNGDGTPEYVPASIDDIVRFDTQTNEAEFQALDKLPTGAWGMGAVWTGTKAALVGGFTFNLATMDAARRDWVLTFDPNAAPGSRLVQTANTLPFPNQDMAAVRLGNTAWFFGGIGDNGTANPCPPIEIRNNENGGTEYSWPRICVTDRIVRMDVTSLAPRLESYGLPYRTQFTAGAGVEGVAYLLGGRAPDGSAYSSILRFDPSTEKVEKMFPTLPGGRFGMPAVTEGTSIRVIGGRDQGQFKDGMTDTIEFITTATEPFAPRNLEIRAPTDGSAGLILTWAPPLYDGGSAILEYRVYRIPEGGEAVLIGKTAGDLTFTDATAKPGAAYVYQVKSVNKFGESPSAAERDTRAATRPPSVPRAFQAMPGDEQALLRWATPADTGGVGLGGYRIYRNDTAKPFKEIPAGISTAESGTAILREFRDAGLANGVTYTYAVSAFNGEGESPKTKLVEVVPAPVPPPPPSLTVAEAGTTALKLTWEIPTGGEPATGFQIFKGTEPDHLDPIDSSGLTGQSTEFIDTSVETGRIYYYAVAATNVNGQSPWTSVASGGLLDAPTPPRNLLATAGPGQVELRWTAPESLGGAESVTYLVTRSSPGSPSQIVASDVVATRHVDRNVIPGTTYQYAIIAVNGLRSDPSTPKSATPLEATNAAPVAVFAVVGGTRANMSQEITFDASLSSDADGRVVKYEWTWGDGTRNTVTNVAQATHKFERDDCFTVSLVVTDDRGAVSTNAAQAFIEVGKCGREVNPGSDENVVAPPTPTGPAPGSGIPAPGVAWVALALVAVALLAGRRRGA